MTLTQGIYLFSSFLSGACAAIYAELTPLETGFNYFIFGGFVFASIFMGVFYVSEDERRDGE